MFVEKASDSELKKLKADCIAITNLHDSMKNSYFFYSSNNAASRRSYETMNSRTTEFIFDEKRYIVKQVTKCSCKNVYYKLSIDTDKETDSNLNIGFINKIIKVIEEKENK